MQNLEPAANDIIVIGAGGCGLMAALVAAKKGAQVLLLEKTDKPGGGTAFSSKGIRAAGSRRQREAKIEDSPELYAQDILGRNNNESDAALTKRLTETSGRVADFLADAAGIEFELGEFAFGHSARRSHSWKAEKTITDFLFEAVEREKNIQVCLSTPVLSLRQESNGAVTGVVIESRVVTGHKVILAAGGFGASRELFVSVYSQSGRHSLSRSLWEHRGWDQNGSGGGSGHGEHGCLPAIPRIHWPGQARGVARGFIRRHHGRPWWKALR